MLKAAVRNITLEPDKDLERVGKSLFSGDLLPLICYQLVPHLDEADLRIMKDFVTTRIYAITENKLKKEALWEDKDPEEVLNTEEVCLLMGIHHPKYNPSPGEFGDKIQAIKALRSRMSTGLKESKEMMDAYQAGVEAGDIIVPIFTPLHEDAPDYTEIEEELL